MPTILLVFLCLSFGLPALRAAESIQSLVDHARAGAEVRVPKGIYRETVTLNKTVQLIAEPGAEIRGSDVWADWTPVGGQWKSKLILPKFTCYGAGSPRSQWPEQVFIDGRPLEQVAADPKSGQFAVEALRRVVLGNDPTHHLVEVTVRTQWIAADADNVLIDGFRMAHAANAPQDHAALATGDHSNWIIRNNTLSDAHGAVVSLVGKGHQLLNNQIMRGGQLGLHGTAIKNCVIRGNKLNQNNTEDFETDWEAGGMKVTNADNLTVDQNEFAQNRGSGIWFDIDCRRCTISGNRVHHNARRGIHWEISDGVKIHDNLVWENGWGFSVWGWGAGILVSTAANAEIYNNVLAWNADGISVISQNRADGVHTVGNDVHDNTVIGSDADPSDPNHDNIYAIAFLQDWKGILGKPGSNNRAENNRIALPPAERSGRFSFPDFSTPSLDAFNRSPGSKGNLYIPASAARAMLKKFGLPLAPEK